MAAEPFDMQKLKTACVYADRIAQGRNPVNNQPAQQNDALNNANVVRCMYFIRDVLQNVMDNGGYVKERRPRPLRREPTAEEYALIAEQFQYRNDKPISYLIRQLYEPLEQAEDYDQIRKITARDMNMALKEHGYLAEEVNPEGKKRYVPTPEGTELGITLETRQGERELYTLCLYNQNAQQYIAAHFSEFQKKKNSDDNNAL